MKGVLLAFFVVLSLNAFSLDGMIDTISNKVSDAVGNKVSESIESIGSDDKEPEYTEVKTSEDKVAKLKELVAMRDAGYITKEEFQKAKKELFQ